MIPKLEERMTVEKLRKQGLSYREIMQQVAVSKSSISLWCKNIQLTHSQKEKLKGKRPKGYLGALANRIKRQSEIILIKRGAATEINELTFDEFKIAGATLYWGEGDKKHSAGVTNSDPQLIKFMMKWFRDVCKVPEAKFKLSIYYHSGQNEEEIKKYWSSLTRVPLSQFHKSIFKKEGTGYRKNILYKGTLKIRICDENLRHRILTWIEKIYETGVRSSVGRATGS